MIELDLSVEAAAARERKVLPADLGVIMMLRLREAGLPESLWGAFAVETWKEFDKAWERLEKSRGLTMIL